MNQRLSTYRDVGAAGKGGVGVSDRYQKAIERLYDQTQEIIRMDIDLPQPKVGEFVNLDGQERRIEAVRVREATSDDENDGLGPGDWIVTFDLGPALDSQDDKA